MDSDSSGEIMQKESSTMDQGLEFSVNISRTRPEVQGVPGEFCIKGENCTIPGAEMACTAHVTCSLCNQQVWVSCQPQGHVVVIVQSESGQVTEISTEVRSKSETSPVLQDQRELASSHQGDLSVGEVRDLSTDQSRSIQSDHEGTRRKSSRVKKPKRFYDIDSSYDQSKASGNKRKIIRQDQSKSDSCMSFQETNKRVKKTPENSVQQVSGPKFCRERSNTSKAEEKLRDNYQALLTKNDKSPNEICSKNMYLEKTTDKIDSLRSPIAIISNNELEECEQIDLEDIFLEPYSDLDGHQQNIMRHSQGNVNTLFPQDGAQVQSGSVQINESCENSTLHKLLTRCAQNDPESTIERVSTKPKSLVMARGMRSYQKKENYLCLLCNKRLTKKYVVKQHMLFHLLEKDHKCDMCGKLFRRKVHMERHKRQIHTEAESRRCEICGKYYSSRGKLRHHQNKHTGHRPYVCHICGKAFSTDSNMKRHISLHGDVKNFACQFCGKKFHQKTHMQDHERIHTGEKPYCCELCGSRFGSSSLMNLHRNRVHLGLRYKSRSKVSGMRGQAVSYQSHPDAIKCDICGKAFLTQSGIITHKLRLHQGKKMDLKCDICGKVSKDMHRRGKHALSHLKEKHFSCEICGKKFNQERNKIRHVRIHTEKTIYTCPICEKTFAQRPYLKAHIKTHENKVREAPVELDQPVVLVVLESAETIDTKDIWRDFIRP